MPETNPSLIGNDLAALCSALVDGTISSADQVRLEDLLRHDRTARDRFRDFMQMESILAWELVNADAVPSPSSIGAGGHSPRAAGWRRVALWLLPLVATAAALAPVVAWLGSRGPVAVETAVAPRDWAMLVDTTGAVWADGRVRAAGSAIVNGPLRLAAGSAQVKFASGAVVTLNAPSEIEVLGDNRLFLRDGSIVPFVPPAAKGFTVVSPTGEVIDLGTEFAVSVGARGETSVYVLDGEVDVASGHGGERSPVRMTQGFGSRLTMAHSSPEVTERPLVIDAFDGPNRALLWRDLDPARTSLVADGELRIPVEFRPHAVNDRTSTQLVLDHDFSSLRGRRGVMSFKVTLPNAGLTDRNRWLACVVDGGTGRPPMAFDTAATLGVLVSPLFEAGVRIEGEHITQTRVFARSEDAVGPYQVLITIDDTAATRDRHGTAVAGVTVNGQELLRERPIKLAEQPRIGLQTYVSAGSAGAGFAIVDDFSISVSTDVE
jgi:hypothetical protein